MRVGPRVTEIRAAGRWVVPGFVDTHAHLPSEAELATRFQALLDHGITGARSPATDVQHGVELEAELDDGERVEVSRTFAPLLRRKLGL